ncbi:hypothetical protein [Legionella taurinensis]|uniref:SecA family profile domain-containing protein n=1 Tax=Legionella taurinensis TaxID=70611 RepID=A0A3A5L766_9GAMM|nr:hypothetical protein [Legionella taurinensis]RJT49127.1 hypothetical protein D6J04_00250 [Legionella taurinensis]RJT67387.1 hypothetical protein D6J03_07210 [Legionella taurinensis]STY26984.1 coiled-coil protein [Legionella taurinensis]
MFFDTPDTESRTHLLISRMVQLQQAIAQNKISPEELATIARLSPATLEKKTRDLKKLDTANPLDNAIKTLLEILNQADPGLIYADAKLIEGLKRFDTEHADYLPLSPLAVENEQTLAIHLSDFAIFYDVFIQHMQSNKIPGDLGDTYNLTLDTLAARTRWLQWKSERPIRMNFNAERADYPGLFEKFLAGRLRKDEWLTDVDIQRQLKILGTPDCHIIPFTEDDLGLALHFAREQHQHDEPLTPYVIPLIVNLGEDGHSRIDSRGNHWARILVEVDPTDKPVKIRVKYTDELQLHEASKKKIAATLKNALKYHNQIGSYASKDTVKFYTAFPDCTDPEITVTGTQEQRDGFTCGYRALRGIIQDLIDAGVIQNHGIYQEFTECKDASSLRDFVYRSLLGQQLISQEMRTALTSLVSESDFEEQDADQYRVKPVLVEGQLLAFALNRGRQPVPKGKLDSKHLEALVVLNTDKARLKDLPAIKAVAQSQGNLTLNLEEILTDQENAELVLDVLFETIGNNAALKQITLTGTEKLNQQFIKDNIDKLTLGIELVAEDPVLSDYLMLVNTRNALLAHFNIKPSAQKLPWDALFEAMLFQTPDKPTQGRFEWFVGSLSLADKNALQLGTPGFVKLLEYIANNQSRFEDGAFDYHTFSMRDAQALGYVITDLGMLTALRDHLQSATPFLPFRQFSFAITDLSHIDQDALLDVLSDILRRMPPEGIQRLEIVSSSLAPLKPETVQALIDLISAGPYATVITFSAPDRTPSKIADKLEELENAGLKNQKRGLSSREHEKTTARADVPNVTLGKIGKAIFQGDLGTLSTEIQVQQQQQQQVQQQVQTSLDDNNLPEEDEVEDELFSIYTGADELLTRGTIGKLEEFIKARHPHLSPEQCWDMITGEEAGLFKYGIKKISVSAARMLIEHLQDVQYGLHPDNLPRGFELQNDADGNVVLAYSAFDAAINPNESPLTIQFSKPLLPNDWAGNALQFINHEQAKHLYDAVIAKLKAPRPSLEDCIRHFFYLKDDTVKLSIQQRLTILQAFISAQDPEAAGKLQALLQGVFGNTLTEKNINALSEVFFDKGVPGLLQLLSTLQELKAIKGDAFFASFKACFIDSSQNLNELLQENNLAAIQKLMAFSTAQATWWLALTEQHTSNIGYSPDPKQAEEDGFTHVKQERHPGARWANLAELAEGFSYFCGQLEEVSPGLHLTEYCPFLTGVADMRVALDRLLSVILPNAHDINEQFYEALPGLSLNGLGPFYASRYEGYKLVTPSMTLNLGSFTGKAKLDVRFSEKGFVYRCDKVNIGANLADGAVGDDSAKQLAIFLRYIATFNHRAPVKRYQEAFELIDDNIQNNNYFNGKESLLLLIAVFGTGKRGKQFQKSDIKTLVNWINLYKDTSKDENSFQLMNIRVMVNAWRGMRMSPIRPTLAEIVTISKQAQNTKQPAQVISMIQELVAAYDEDAQDYIETLTLLCQNPRAIELSLFQEVMRELEGLNNRELKKIADAKAQVLTDHRSLRVSTTRLIAVCTNEGLDEENADKKIRELYEAVTQCLNTHGDQTTHDLLELLGHIDVKSKALPSLDQLIAIVRDVAAKEKPEYSTLEQTVKAALPKDCTIQLEQVIAAPVESGGNLQTIIAKYMSEILNELASFKGLIENELGEGFFKMLATPEGPHALIKGLNKMGKFSGFLGDVVKGKITGVMTNVYNTVINDGIANVGIRDEATRARLAKIINNKMNHPVKKADFDAFIGLYAGELDSLSKLLGDLQRIHKTWPSDLRSVIAAFDESPSLKEYPLVYLAKITGALVSGFNPNDPFPTNLLRQFLAFNDPSEQTLKAIAALIDTVFDPDKQKTWSDQEKQAVCELGLAYCHRKPDNILNYLTAILELRSNNSELFIQKLHILAANQDIGLKGLIKNINLVEGLNNPALTQSVFSFFTQSKAADFSAFIEAANDLDQVKMALIMSIALRAAEKEQGELDSKYDQKLLVDTVNQLKQVDAETLKQLGALYSTPTYPRLSELAQITLSVSPDMDALKRKYDLDPFGKRDTAKTLDEHFDASEVINYLNNLQDMNYGRPMLLSQRQQLQKWFLYINGIGKDFGIPIIENGKTSAQLKAVKDMSHKEIHDLLDYYKSRLKEGSGATDDQRLKARLEVIALLREVMYRATGNMPRPTQIMYLLLSMQTSQNLVGEIKTGEGKSMTAALAAALANLEGKTVDICTANSFLASEGLEENHAFFNYLGMPVKLITAKSGFDDYQANAIHYSSMSDVALYRSKMQLEGKVFPDNCALIADEVDFSTLDDSTRYRYATTLDASTDPYKSPYTWIYEALINFTDAQTIPRSDADLQALAKAWLRNAAKSKEEKQQLKKLEEQPELYQKRLEGWLIAAGKTKHLIDQEETKFRVVTLAHPKFGQVSKACILTGGRPNIDAEFSNGIQQFLHVRLRQKYRDAIDDGTKPDFLVEPEKTYVTSLNSRLLMSTYQRILGMTGTAGSKKEIIEQYAKYGFRFAGIPKFTKSNLRHLDPLLTQAKYLDDPEAEEQEHIQLIVKDVLRYIRSQPDGLCGPVLIQCPDKTQGEKIYQALHDAIEAAPEKYKHKLNPDFLQRFYSSEKPTAKERNDEEKLFKDKAGLDGVITISSVFDRGTDIKPTHANGLYAIQTSADTAPHSTEDLERALQQKSGRPARKGQPGFTRMILRRSEFKEVYADSPKKLRNLKETIQEVERAIALLNNIRNKPRSEDRDLRESFDGIKDLIYQEFFNFITQIHATSATKASKKAIINQLLGQWNVLLGNIDNYWETLEHNPALQGKNTAKITRLAEFAAREWNEYAQQDGMLRAHLLKWATHNKITIDLPEERTLDDIGLIDQITIRHAPLGTHYVKRTQLHGQLFPVAPAAVYADMMDIEADSTTELKTVAEDARSQAITAVIRRQLEWLSTPAYQQQLAGKFTLDAAAPLKDKVQTIMAAMLYLRYKAYRSGNSVGYARFSNACEEFINQMIWSRSDQYIEAVAKAQQEHFVILTAHRGEHEKQKTLYLPVIMAENLRLLPESTGKWKKDSFAHWWAESPSNMRGQAIEWLTSYRDHWWKRSWVSGDRKDIVTKLLLDLNNDTLSAAEILQAIHQAKSQLLSDDIKHKRHLGSGSNGRLYNYLNELEVRIHAAMPPEEIDANRKTEFDAVADVLAAYVDNERLPAQSKEKVKKLSEFLTAYRAVNPSNKKNSLIIYKQLLDLFEYIASLPGEDEDLQALQEYCRYARNRLVYYFYQGEESSTLNRPRSIEVYQALTYAGTAFFHNQTGNEKPPVLQLPPKQFKYTNQTIEFVSKDPQVINQGMHYPFFTQVNQASTYRELMAYLERFIVEKSLQDTRIQFKKIELGDCALFNPGFTLTVHALIDDKPVEVEFNLDMKSGAMYAPMESLYELDESLDHDKELKELTEQTEAIKSRWAQQKSEGVVLLTEIREALDKLNPSVKEQVEEDYKVARAEANLQSEERPDPNTYFGERLKEIKKQEHFSPNKLPHKS